MAFLCKYDVGGGVDLTKNHFIFVEKGWEVSKKS